jgi:hypothetical protein
MAERRPIVIAAAFHASFDFLVATPADAQPTCTYTIVVLTGRIGDLGSNTVLAFAANGGRSQFRLIAPAGCGSYANTVDLGAVPDTNWQLVGPR